MLADKDAEVRDSARRALQKNPSPAATAALIAALDSAADTGAKAAILNAIGLRAEPGNIALLTKHAGSDSEPVRAAAIIALSRLAVKEAVAPIEAALAGGSARMKVIAADALLSLAERLCSRGNAEKAAALAVYRKFAAGPAHLRCASIVGLGRSGGPAELPAIFAALTDSDASIRGAAGEALSLIRGDGVAGAIISKARSSEGTLRAAVLAALVKHGDKSAAAVFAAFADDPDKAVRSAAIEGLAAVGEVHAVAVLLKAAACAGEQQAPARVGLQFIKGPGVEKALISAVDDAQPAIRAEAIRALSARRCPAAAAKFLTILGDPDASIKVMALRALGAAATPENMPAIVAVLTAIAGRSAEPDKCSAAILTALGGAAGEARLALLRVLGRIGGRNAIAALVELAGKADEQARDAAIRALSDCPDPAAADVLLTLARSAASETHHVLAIRGYIRLCRLGSGKSGAQPADMLAAALAAARRPEEKKQAVSALGEVRDLSALRILLTCLDDAALKEEAASAIVRLGQGMGNKEQKAVTAALSKVIEVSGSERTRRAATETLDKAGKGKK
jgi:HEAT repeat protein